VFDGAAMNGTGCDADGSLCTVSDACQGGSCKAGGALNCDDAQVCTSDSCNPTTGCVHTPNGAPCNDGNACTGPDVCAGGACAPATLSCDDLNPCTTDTCNPLSGCVHTDVPNKTSCGGTSYCFTGVCTAGKCGDTILTPALGEQCDDGNVVGGDGCSALCIIEDTACADGTREGTLDKITYPKIAQCDGSWTGSIGSLSPLALCGKNFHTCNPNDKTLMNTITQANAFQPGCWAANAANDNGQCSLCKNTEDTNDMSGIGKDCKGKITNYGNSCISPTYRIDAAIGCVRGGSNPMPWIKGVLCCAN